jgi:hypothetical protein
MLNVNNILERQGNKPIGSILDEKPMNFLLDVTQQPQVTPI